MASTALRVNGRFVSPSNASAPRRRSSAGLKKLEGMKSRMAAARARASRVASDRIGTLVSAGAAVGVGLAEKKGYRLPTVGGVEPTLLAGVALAFVGPMLVKGNTGRLVGCAGEGLLSVAAYKAGLGQPMMSGDDDDSEGLEGGGWSPA